MSKRFLTPERKEEKRESKANRLAAQAAQHEQRRVYRSLVNSELVVADKAQADAIEQQNILGKVGIRSSLYPQIELGRAWDRISWELAVAPEQKDRAQEILAAL